MLYLINENHYYTVRFLRYYLWISKNVKNDLMQNDFIARQSTYTGIFHQINSSTYLDSINYAEGEDLKVKQN